MKEIDNLASEELALLDKQGLLRGQLLQINIELADVNRRLFIVTNQLNTYTLPLPDQEFVAAVENMIPRQYNK